MQCIITVNQDFSMWKLKTEQTERATSPLVYIIKSFLLVYHAWFAMFLAIEY